MEKNGWMAFENEIYFLNIFNALYCLDFFIQAYSIKQHIINLVELHQCMFKDKGYGFEKMFSM